MTDLPPSTVQIMLDAVLVPGETYYLSLHSGDPGTTGANELSGGAYGRQAITFGATNASGVKASSSSQSFVELPPGDVTNVGVWQVASAGTYLLGGTGYSTAAEPLPSGATVNFPTAAVTVTLS